MHHLAEQANDLLSSQAFEYAVCGGLGVDLFLGRETRAHGDIDIHAYWDDRNAIISFMRSKGFEAYEMLGGAKAERPRAASPLPRLHFCRCCAMMAKIPISFALQR